MTDAQIKLLTELSRMLERGQDTGKIVLTKEDLAMIPAGSSLHVSLQLLEGEPVLCDTGENEE